MKPALDATEPSGSGSGAEAKLEELRREIARIDDTLVRVLGERVRLARAAAGYKREGGMPTLDPAREAAVVRRAADAARDQHLPADAMRAIFWQIIALCRGAQIDAD